LSAAPHVLPLKVPPAPTLRAPAQVSLDGAEPRLQVPQAQEPLQVCVPLQSPELQPRLVPAQQVHPSSHEPSQSSSIPLHVSAGAMQASQVQVPVQARVPWLPQDVVQ
jgi:hypothetical protein